MQKKYPKFTRIQLCMARNPEYGLVLAPEAVSMLRKDNITISNNNGLQSVKQASKKENRTKRNRVSFRMSDELFGKFEQLRQNGGTKSNQEFLENIVKEYLECSEESTR